MPLQQGKQLNKQTTTKIDLAAIITDSSDGLSLDLMAGEHGLTAVHLRCLLLPDTTGRADPSRPD